MTLEVKFKKLDSSATIPTYATDGSACFDLYACDKIGHEHPTDEMAWIFPLGLAVEIPKGWALLIFSRSGHGFKDAVRLSNCVGVIDSDYRGEVCVSLRKDCKGPTKTLYYSGERIAQGLLVQVPQVLFTEVAELTETGRGTGGFGSTGR